MMNPMCFSRLVINLGMELKMKRSVVVQVRVVAVELVAGATGHRAAFSEFRFSRVSAKGGRLCASFQLL
jgi:hypothetical protein